MQQFRFNPLTHRFDLVDTSSSPTGDVQFLAGDSGGNVGPNGSGVINVLGNPDIDIAGNPGTSTLQLTDLTKITPFVVNGDGIAGQTVAYTTIQSAIDAASAAFIATGNEQTVWIYAGTYTENLTLADGVDLLGAGSISQGAGNGVTIVGQHTPPLTGHVVLRNMYWQSPTSILSSNAAGTCHIHFIDTESGVTDGWLFNLPNWTGILEIENYNPGTGATNDGGINNTAGAPVLLFNAGLGWGNTRTCIISGPCLMESGEFNAPMVFTTGSEIDIEWITFRNTVVCEGNSTGLFDFCSWFTNAGAPLTMNSTANIEISACVFNTTNNPCIAGTGTGQLILNTNSFLGNSRVAASVNAQRNVTDVGTLYAQNISFDEGTNTVDQDGELIIGATGLNPKISTLTAGSGISITNGPGSITINVTGGGLTWTEVTGISQSAAVNNGYITNNAALVTVTLPVSAAFGTLIAVVGKGSGGWRIAQNAGQQIFIGTQNTTSGVGGHLDSTATRDSVFLLCTTTDLTWTMVQSVGNIGVT